MKNLALLLLLTTHLFAQSTQEKCQQNACYGYGPPSGTCSGAFIYSDISVTPVQAYSCKSNAWAAQGGGSSTPLPANLTAVATDGTGTPQQATAIPQAAVVGLTTIQTNVTANTTALTSTRAQGLYYASPCSSTGAPGYRSICATDLPVFGASGGSHAIGAVPDPGASAGTTRYLREDGTWTAPVGGVSSVFGRTGAVAATSGDYSFSLISGSLSATQMPALTGDVTSTAGTTATIVPKLAAVPIAGASGNASDLLSSSTSGSVVPLTRLAHCFSIGDSYTWGSGSLNPVTDSAFAILTRNFPCVPEQRGVPGTTTPTQALSAFQYVWHDPIYPSWFHNGTFLNDSAQDTCGGTAGTNCVKNAVLARDAEIMHEAIPEGPYKVRASLLSGSSGTVTADATIPLYAPAATATFGTAMKITSSGGQIFITLPSSPFTEVGLTYVVGNALTGSFNVAIQDGAGSFIAQTDYCSGTATFVNTGCGGQALFLATTTAFRQSFAVTANTTHVIRITTLSANSVPIISADIIPPTTVTNRGIVTVMGSPHIASGYGSTAIYDAAEKALAQAENAAGATVFFADLAAGTPGMNLTTDVSGVATTSCAGTQSTNHPNGGNPNQPGTNCGQDHMAQTVYNALIASGYYLGTYNGAGNNIATTGVINNTLTLTPSTSSLLVQQGAGTPGRLHQICPFGTSFNATTPCGIMLSSIANVYSGIEAIVDGSTGTAWAGAAMIQTFSPGSFWAGFAAQDGVNSTTSSHNTVRWATQLSTGNSAQLGSATAPQFIASGTAPTIAAGAGAGTSPTLAITGANMAGVVTLTAGTTPSASAIVGTVTFSGTVTTAPKGCSVTPQNLATIGIPVGLSAAPTTGGWILDVGATAFTAATVYAWNYSCF